MSDGAQVGVHAWLAVRSLLWTILLPGFVAGYDEYSQRVGPWMPGFRS